MLTSYVFYHIENNSKIDIITENIDNITLLAYSNTGDVMYGIDLDQEIKYLTASFRYFKEKEYHVTRLCKCDVLLLVFEGVLRFVEDGIAYAVHPGQYHIQKHDSYQEGKLPSDGAKYLYIHFMAQWTDSSHVLPRSGSFDTAALMPDMEAMHALDYEDAPYILRAGMLYKLLSQLYKPHVTGPAVKPMVEYIRTHMQSDLSLELLCREFSFSKNHIINLFKKELGMTPVAYLNDLRLRQAERLLIATSQTIESIATTCGYPNYSHFYRQFLRKNGVSPEKFRQKKHLG